MTSAEHISWSFLKTSSRFDGSYNASHHSTLFFTVRLVYPQLVQISAVVVGTIRHFLTIKDLHPGGVLYISLGGEVRQGPSYPDPV